MDLFVNNHSSICINNNIYFDPFKIDKSVNNAKYIFITHNHYDHLSVDDIKKVINDNTKIICTKNCLNNLQIFKNDKLIVKPNNSYKIEDLSFSTIPSYNIDKNFHKREDGNVGYLLNIENKIVAILGDTDVTEETKNIKCDILFIPIGGTYTMDAISASKLTNLIKPNLVIPVHYNCIVGTKNDEKIFIENLDKNLKYKILL